MKILSVDIENAPGSGYFWGLWDQNIALSQLIQPSRVICFAAKWLDSKEMIFKSEFHNSHDEMLSSAHALLDEADAVIGYNSRKFDVKHLNREFFLANLEPPSPFKHIDLMETAKKQFAFMSNKLQFLLTETKIGSKLEHEGFPLWEKCMAGDEAAWVRMRRYNENDTRETEKLYKALLPWIPNHPSHGAHNAEDACPQCGGKRLIMEGTAYTSTGQYQRYHCKDCGRWSRGTQRNARTTIVGLNS